MIINILHIIISINLLISTAGVSIFRHVCKKNGTTLSFYIKSKTCCSGKKSKCHINLATNKGNSNTVVEFKKKPCCEDLSHFVKVSTPGIKLLIISAWKDLNVEKLLSTIPVAGFFNNVLFNSLFSVQHYRPPQIILDIVRMIRIMRC